MMEHDEVNALKRGDKVSFGAPFGSLVRGVVLENFPIPGDYLPVVVEWENGYAGRIGWPDSHRLTKL